MKGQAIFIQNEYSDDNQPLYQADCDDYGGLGVSSSDMSSPEILRSPIQKSDSIFSLAGDRAKISAWDAGWNVTNAIQGMFVLCLPFAIKHGGYMGLILIIGTAVICNYTGLILVDCLYETEPNGRRVRIRSSYSDIAAAVWGERIANIIINTCMVTECTMICVLYIVVVGDLTTRAFESLDGSTPIPHMAVCIIATLILLPCIFLRDLKEVSRFSMGCSVAQFLVLGMIMIYCFSKVSTWQWNEIRFNYSAQEFPVSVGVIVFSYTSQLFLPSLEGDMEKRGDFKKMLNFTHLAAAAAKAIFALVCFLTWVENTEEEVTNNLPRALRSIVNLSLVIKALLSYPLPFFAALETLEISLFPLFGFGKTWFTFKADRSLTLQMLIVRLGFILGTLLLAVCVPHFDLLMGLTGSLTGSALSFIFPCIFHISIKRLKLRYHEVFFDVTIIMLGVFFSVTGFYNSISLLVQQYLDDDLDSDLSSTLATPQKSELSIFNLTDIYQPDY
ncbi:Oidioi.mRNA.OKI2018_I69.chr1.g233.t1.cds [Oikopleura dioica]|uniref:Vesicular inhibitory amino acid transporter n=1 Tax=Oikopleura dioica TaxID=34765 RepID=A0ABN7SNP3_OIKDI|nr:Oidioi.mRNA.OKI2018_I69.chr1.g233.t1.cds [Oikopleura dioica]